MRFNWLYLRFIFICSLSMMHTGMLLSMDQEQKAQTQASEEGEILAEKPTSFTHVMHSLRQKIIISAEIGDFIKNGIFKHLLNVTNKAFNGDQSAYNNLIGLYKATALCPNKTDIIIQHLKYSTVISTKLMANIMAFFNIFTWRRLNKIPISIPVGLNQSLFGKNANTLTQLLERLAKKRQIDTLEGPQDPHFLCQEQDQALATDTSIAVFLIQGLQRNAQDAHQIYAIVALTQLVSEAYNEQFTLEDQLLLGKQPSETPQKNLLNAILQRAFIGDSSIGYSYFLNSISLLSKYTFQKLEKATAALNTANSTYIQNQQSLFNSILNRTTLSFFKQGSTARRVHQAFNKLNAIFNHIMADRTFKFKSNVLRHLINIVTDALKTKNFTNLNNLTQKSQEEVYDILKVPIMASWWPSRDTILRILPKLLQPDWQTAWANVMEQWVTVQLEQLLETP